MNSPQSDLLFAVVPMILSAFIALFIYYLSGKSQKEISKSTKRIENISNRLDNMLLRQEYSELNRKISFFNDVMKTLNQFEKVIFIIQQNKAHLNYFLSSTSIKAYVDLLRESISGHSDFINIKNQNDLDIIFILIEDVISYDKANEPEYQKTITDSDLDNYSLYLQEIFNIIGM